jgi:hypothetical protein
VQLLVPLVLNSLRGGRILRWFGTNRNIMAEEEGPLWGH